MDNRTFGRGGGDNDAGLYVFGAILIAGLSLIVGYFISRYQHSSSGHPNRHWAAAGHTLYIALLVAGVIYGLTSAKIAAIYRESVIAFLLGVPLIYALVLFTQFSLLASGLIPFSAHTYFLTSAVSAVLGACLLALANAAAMIRHETEIEDRDIRMTFWSVASIAAPFAYLIAVMVPVYRHAAFAVLLVVGAMTGVVAVAALSVFTALVQPEPQGNGWRGIASWLIPWYTEIVFGGFLLGALLVGIVSHSWRWLVIALPAGIVVGAWSRRAALRGGLRRLTGT